LKELTVCSDAPGEKMFMLGNEAIARGAIEAGVQVAAAYPGTPSSEVTETLAEVAKDVGLNVAHDPLVTASYIGAKGGFVLLCADDPWAWSSQNEQDNRYIAEQACVPILEPSSVQEAKDMMVEAFRLSEEFRQLFMLRSVTRISHGRGDVSLGEIAKERRQGIFERNTDWLIYTPIQCRKNKPLMLERFERIKEAVNTSPYNNLKLIPGAKLGVIASGLSYSYTLEAIHWLGLEDKISVLKIGTPHPLPEKLVKELLASVGEVLVVEELDPFVENHVKAIAGEVGIKVKIHGKDLVPRMGELSARKVTEAIARLTGAKAPIDFNRIDEIAEKTAPLLPWRPPTLCAGCPHRASQYEIGIAARRVARDYGQDVKPIFPGDIGCYNLAYTPPLNAVDTTVCMGGSFGIANGLAHVVNAPVVTHLGDSTFFHSGIPPMINAVYNQANITMVVLDNSATAMTGFQPHPGTGSTATGEAAPALKIEDIARACGVPFVEVVDPFDVKKAVDTFERAIRFEGPALVVSRRVCTMIEQREKRRKGEPVVPYRVNQEKCSEKCETCITLLGCPAIIREDGKTIIDDSLCSGCGLCAEVCPYKAIVQE
jgi:indolepyruvate ferredoxin oxidoreductase alpha subunit